VSDSPPYKIPQSVLVVIYTPALDVLLIRRHNADPTAAAHWQSVTGSKDSLDEQWAATAVREVWEETGIACLAEQVSEPPPASRTVAERPTLQDWHLQNTYDIYPRWQHRYAPGVTRNTERVYGLCVATGTPVVLSPLEHTAYQWLPWRDAADACFSASNAEAILLLPKFAK
jgi:dihydroneopterin triphosphate diphosphatase